MAKKTKIHQIIGKFKRIDTWKLTILCIMIEDICSDLGRIFQELQNYHE